MTHAELLTQLFWGLNQEDYTYKDKALRAVVELHKPEQLSEDEFVCLGCIVGTSQFGYPCPTIQAIEKELK